MLLLISRLWNLTWSGSKVVCGLVYRGSKITTKEFHIMDRLFKGAPLAWYVTIEDANSPSNITWLLINKLNCGWWGLTLLLKVRNSPCCREWLQLEYVLGSNRGVFPMLEIYLHEGVYDFGREMALKRDRLVNLQSAFHWWHRTVKRQANCCYFNGRALVSHIYTIPSLE